MSGFKNIEEIDTGELDPGYTKLKSRDLPYFTKDEGVEEIRDFFETYSGIPPDQLGQHIVEITNESFSAEQALGYQSLSMHRSICIYCPLHHKALPLEGNRYLKETPDATFLDVGAYIAYDVRALHFAGIPSSTLNGTDLLPFWDLGYELFRDRDRFSATFCHGDILDFSEDSEAARMFDGNVDVVFCGAIIHQFEWERGVLACKRLLKYARKSSGAMIAGNLVGSNVAEGIEDFKKYTSGKYTGKNPVKHSAESIKRLWKQASEELGMDLPVEANWRTWESIDAPKSCVVMGPDFGMLEFAVLVP
ncbi:hypothetical protein NA57DRAFT_75998 [Rhizodiscina lignyota]|uniref:Methyltransferase domain-containing protein n=1 Tax=Rhizodiscina lignyota TaxID=1504668 RepID=A0A9P4IDC6_9PEZI|nr:hypothetical protein NA57DRAFT_75998 [Rhizodiscina lignyota]